MYVAKTTKERCDKGDVIDDDYARVDDICGDEQEECTYEVQQTFCSPKDEDSSRQHQNFRVKHRVEETGCNLIIEATELIPHQYVHPIAKVKKISAIRNIDEYITRAKIYPISCATNLDKLDKPSEMLNVLIKPPSEFQQIIMTW